MNSTYRRRLVIAARALGVVLASGTAVTVGAVAIPSAIAAAGPRATPPWEPDPDSVGGLVFYNAAGTVITGGSLTDSPIAAYVEGTSTIYAGDTKATLFGYLPVNGLSPGAWSGEQLGSSTVYPDVNAPAPLDSAALPVETGGSGDENISTLEADFPNNDSSSDGYANMYVLRLKTSAPGQSETVKYDSADIEVNNTAGTWSVVYSQTLQVPAIDTTTTLSVSPPSSAYYGTGIKLSATVSPASAVGSVEFLAGTKLLATVPLNAGTASYTTSSLADGTEKLSAAFVPTDAADFVASSSTVENLKISARATTTSLTASHSKLTKGEKLTLTANERPDASGHVVFYDGKHKLKTVAVSKGTAHYSSSSLTVGSHSFKATFIPSNSAALVTSSSKTVKVTVTKPIVKKKK
jgi:hypothetical protein